jgi:hypothetical protein
LNEGDGVLHDTVSRLDEMIRGSPPAIVPNILPGNISGIIRDLGWDMADAPKDNGLQQIGFAGRLLSNQGDVERNVGLANRPD